MLYNKAWDKPAANINDPVSLLLRAAEIIEEVGLAKGHFIIEDGHYGQPIGAMCIQGAVIAAAGLQVDVSTARDVINSRPELTTAVRMFGEAIPESFYSGHEDKFGHAISFNNNYTVSQQDVVATARRAALAA